MRQKVMVKILMIVMVSAVILLVLAVGFHVRLTFKMNLVTTYVAAKDILPRTKISESDLIEMRVPKMYLQDYTYDTKEEIIGKYTEIQGTIPAGSPFYKSMLFTESEIPDYPSTLLEKGQAAYSMEVDLAKLGGTVVSGQRVDIHFSVTRKDEGSMSGCLIQNVRIIAIKDHRGLDIQDENSSGTPYLAVLAVDQDDVSFLSLADQLGELRLITSSSTYDTSKEAVLVQDSPVLAYLLQQQDVPMP